MSGVRRVLALLALLALAAAALAAADVVLLPEEEYYALPRLFHLDDYGACLARRGGEYCLGSFDLAAPPGDPLFAQLQKLSSDRRNFNHTRLHRGYCVSARCPGGGGGGGETLEQRFVSCVQNQTRAQHGLAAQPRQLEYCKRAGEPRRRAVDELDVAFAYAVAAIVAVNLLGTAYDFFRNKDNKPNRFLMAWSLRVNWQRLTASYDDGDARLSALKPVQGMKAITLVLVIMAHTNFAAYISYLYNPLFLETVGRHPLSYYYYNGSIIVQTFVMVSSFLFAYNYLLYVDGDPKREVSLKMLPQCLFHRIARLTPVYMFVLGLATTWWTHANDGTLWTPLVETEVARCRQKWWLQLLYVNNLYQPDGKCLIQTWFLAVDMQLYVVATILTLTIGRWPRAALKLFVGLLLTTLVAIFAASYLWNITSVLFLMEPEIIRQQLWNEPSFYWLYTAPWGSLPASLIGLIVAFLHHDLQKREVRLGDYVAFRVAYRLSVPLMFLWVLAGCWFHGLSSRWSVALYTALDRPVFVGVTAIAMLGFFNKVDDLLWRFLSWRGFQILGRLSLPVLLFHWSYNLSIVAGRLLPTQASVLELGSDWLTVIFLTYVSALPAHLFVEVPAQRFLNAIAGGI